MLTESTYLEKPTEHDAASRGTEYRDFRSFESALEHVAVNFLFRPKDRANFNGRIRRRQIGDVILAEMRVDPSSGVREVDVNRAENYICLTMYQRGRQRFSQHGRQIDVCERELLIWDGCRSSHFECMETTEVRTIMFPRSMLELRIGRVDDLVGCNGTRGQLTTHALYSHLDLIHDCIEDILPDRRGQVIDSTIELMTACLMPETFGTNDNGHRHDILRAAQNWVRERLGENLTVIDLSLHFGLSTRSMQNVFASAGTTFSAFVRQQRLERAALALRSSTFTSVSITEIAYRYGFADSAHFSRSFKANFGMSPQLYRKATTM